MTISQQIFQFVQQKYRAVPSPRLTRVVKSPDLGGKRKSPFTAIALDNDAVGISYNLFHRNADDLARYRAWDASEIIGQPATEVMARFLADDPLDRTIGFATINALCQALFKANPTAYGLDFDTTVLDELAAGPADTVGMVGFFPPTAHHLLGQVKELIVVEMSDRLLTGPLPFTMTADPAALARCNKVLITATTMLNDTLDSLMGYCADANPAIMIGPSAGICPQPLFDLGIDVIGGTFISQPDRFLQRFARGEKWGDAKRKFVLKRPPAHPA